MGYRVGVDIGGTFADFCALDEDTGALTTVKVLTTPTRPGQEVIDGLTALEERFGIAPSTISYFTHGTTVGINSIIQRKGIRLCLLATENFIDVLELARLKMPDPYHLLSARPEPLVTRDRVLPVRERIRADGGIETPLERNSVVAALDKARAMGCEGFVLSFLHSYRNPAHELEAEAILRELAPELPVFASHKVRPIVREYERSSTAILHGYVQPRVSHYLQSLQGALGGIGVAAEAMITKSNGGVMTAELGKTACAQMLLSGTAAGVMGAAFVARQSGADRVLSLDIGGTSSDVAVIVDGQPGFGSAEMVGEFPLFMPTVSVTSIGEGGGSIASIDRGGILRVGPESAGSTPGPACYGRGGERATITDAFAVLGLVGVQKLGYGMVGIDRDKAVEVVRALAGPLGRSVEATAEGIVQVSVSGMFREVSKLCSRRGLDVRDFTLLAFGGAGPMMACFLARELGMARVLVPATPGVLSALGGLTADAKNDFVETAYYPLGEETLPRLSETVERLSEQALAWLREEQGYRGEARLLASAEMRYQGQSFEIEVALERSWIEMGDLASMRAAFNREHMRLYGHADEAAAIQIIAINLVAVGPSPQPVLPSTEPSEHEAKAAGSIAVHLDGQAAMVPFFARADLAAGAHFAGPCVVAQDDTTTIVPSGFDGSVDRHGNIHLTYGGASGAH